MLFDVSPTYTWQERVFDSLYKTLIRPLNDLRYWVMYRFFKEHRYNVIYTGLRPNYYDIDVILEAGMITLLKRYVEDERGGYESLMEWAKYLEEDDNVSTHAEQERTILKIYNWFVNERDSLQTDANALGVEFREANNNAPLLHKLSTGGYEYVPYTERLDLEERRSTIENHINDTDTIYLCAMVKLRKSLWT